MTLPLEVLPTGLQDLLRRFQEGNAPALARAITTVENERDGFQALLHRVLKVGPRTVRVGFTGPPGAGKSSLVSGMAAAYRARDERLGVVAVDPTSPYSGGALLGDRIRMNDLATDPGIFIRSMATRGSLGGLATTSKEVVDLMDAFGFDRVLVETVGVGQTELEITAAADTVVVVLVPESGDGIQAMKAGLMEIADIFVINKADRPGADRLLKEIRQAMHLRAGETMRNVPAHHGVDLSRVKRRERSEDPPATEAGWSIPVLKTVAQTGEGVPELLEAVDRHREWMTTSGELERRRRERARIRVRDVVERELRRTAWRSTATDETLRDGLDRIQAGDDTPYSVAAAILAGILSRGEAR
ncbi:MAG TPA: methylmalonyl Co-A mutase-associated GTPase MeaB [Longimicrobiales bacterium]|nr:methylmalonyl Co-A mutase-associated GTPase MeaB [Longimicrobiales bacterium]